MQTFGSCLVRFCTFGNICVITELIMKSMSEDLCYDAFAKEMEIYYFLNSDLFYLEVTSN